MERKKNSLKIYDLYITNLFHISKKVAKREADNTSAIEVQNNMHYFYLPYLGYNKIILIPVLMSDNTNFYKPNYNKSAFDTQIQTNNIYVSLTVLHNKIR